MLVKVDVFWPYEMGIPTVNIVYNSVVYTVQKADVLRDHEDMVVDDSKLTEQTKMQTSYR